jgi:hypothetical protein
MKEQPVALDILFVLYRHALNHKTGLHVNAIYKELVASNRIPKNKNRVIEALNDLKESDLIETTMSGIQKEIKTLKPLGHEFVKLTSDIDKHVNTCAGLLNLILDILDVEEYSDEKVQRNMLRNMGWTPEEIDDSENILECCKDLGFLVSPYAIISVVLLRYISVLSKIKNNETAKTILNQIMMKRINNLLSNTINKKDGKELKWPEEYLIEEKIKNITSSFDHFYHHNSFTDVKVGDVLKSLIDVLPVTKGHQIWGLTRRVEHIYEKEYMRESRHRRGKVRR